MSDAGGAGGGSDVVDTGFEGLGPISEGRAGPIGFAESGVSGSPGPGVGDPTGAMTSPEGQVTPSGLATPSGPVPAEGGGSIEQIKPIEEPKIEEPKVQPTPSEERKAQQQKARKKRRLLIGEEEEGLLSPANVKRRSLLGE